MTIDEPVLALAATPRAWARRLHAHVADHGGALVRVTVLRPREAREERYDVLVVDDVTSYLDAALVRELQAQGKAVLGLFDPEDPDGKGRLVELAVDVVLPADTEPDELLAAAAALRSRASTRVGPPHRPTEAPSAPVLAVGAAPGGHGATEVAIELAAARARHGHVVLVDGDDHAPGLAARLGLSLHPNILTAADAVQRDTGGLVACLTPLARGGRLAVLSGLAAAGDWHHLPSEAAGRVLRGLAAVRDTVVVNVGAMVEDVATTRGGRFRLTRDGLGAATQLVAVTLPQPAAVARTADWLAAVNKVADLPTTLAVNRCGGAREAHEVAAEICRHVPLDRWVAIPHDPRVTRAAWRGTRVVHGPFRKAVARLAAATATEVAR